MIRTIGIFGIPVFVLVLGMRRHFRAALVAGLSAAVFVVPWQLWVSAHQAEIAPVMVGKFGSYGSWDDKFVKIDGKWFFTRHTIYNETNPNRFTAGQENPLKN